MIRITTPLAWILVCTAMVPSLLTSAPAPTDIHKPTKIPKSTLQKVFSPYWSIVSGHQSTVELHNNLIDKPLVVRPVLLSPAGDRTELQEVKLGPLENSAIDLRDAVSQSGTPDLRYGSAVFEYMNPYGGALLVETTVTEAVNTLAYTIIGSERGAKSARLHGIFWFPPGKGSKAYVALQNISGKTVHVAAYLGTEAGRQIGAVTLGPQQSEVIETEMSGNEPSRSGNRFGSVLLTHDGPEDALNTSGWTEMETTGYSNMMTIYDSGRHHGTTLYGTQVFLGRTDGMLASGKSLKIESYLVLLNTSDIWISPRGDLSFDEKGRVQTAPLLIPPIPPHQSIEVDFSDYIVPSDTSPGAVRVSYDGPEAALVGRVFGTADKTFGFYTTLETQVAPAASEVYWTAQGDAASLLTVTNFGRAADKVSVVITYNGGSTSLPAIALQPLESTTVSIRRLRDQGALPSAAEYGGFRIFGSSPVDSRILVKEHVISEKQGTSAPFYGGWTYIVSYDFVPGAAADLDLNLTEQKDFYAVATFSDSSAYEEQNPTVGSSDWSIVSIADGWNDWVQLETGLQGGSTWIGGTSHTYAIDFYGTMGNLQVQPAIIVRYPASIAAVGSPGVINCGGAGSNGFEINVLYQLYDNYGHVMPASGLQPREAITNWVLGGNSLNNVDQAFGSPTDSSGQFHDSPYGLCYVTPITSTFSQEIYFSINGHRYTVRNNSASFSATGSGTGTMTNGSDASVTR